MYLYKYKVFTNYVRSLDGCVFAKISGEITDDVMGNLKISTCSKSDGNVIPLVNLTAPELKFQHGLDIFLNILTMWLHAESQHISVIQLSDGGNVINFVVDGVN